MLLFSDRVAASRCKNSAGLSSQQSCTLSHLPGGPSGESEPKEYKNKCVEDLRARDLPSSCSTHPPTFVDLSCPTHFQRIASTYTQEETCTVRVTNTMMVFWVDSVQSQHAFFISQTVSKSLLLSLVLGFCFLAPVDGSGHGVEYSLKIIETMTNIGMVFVFVGSAVI